MLTWVYLQNVVPVWHYVDTVAGTPMEVFSKNLFYEPSLKQMALTFMFVVCIYLFMTHVSQNYQWEKWIKSFIITFCITIAVCILYIYHLLSLTNQALPNMAYKSNLGQHIWSGIGFLPIYSGLGPSIKNILICVFQWLGSKWYVS